MPSCRWGEELAGTMFKKMKTPGGTIGPNGLTLWRKEQRKTSGVERRGVCGG